jgi:hypothetical protein
LHKPETFCTISPGGTKCRELQPTQSRMVLYHSLALCANTMELSEPLTGLSHKEVRGRAVLSLSKGVGVDINGLAQDSRQVQAGDLFVAVKGLNADGHEFIPDAIRRGAVAVVGERA